MENDELSPLVEIHPLALQICKLLVLQMAQDNSWGCRKISGELKKIGHEISHSSVFNILNKHGISTDPNGKALSWKKFISSHMDSLWASDFFTEEVWTLGGLVTFYVLFFIHLSTRKVYVAGITTSHNTLWMQQQARNFLMVLDGILDSIGNHSPVVLMDLVDPSIANLFN